MSVSVVKASCYWMRLKSDAVHKCKYGKTIEKLVSENLTAQQICVKKPFILIPQVFSILVGQIIISST